MFVQLVCPTGIFQDFNSEKTEWLVVFLKLRVIIRMISPVRTIQMQNRARMIAYSLKKGRQLSQVII